MAICPVRGAAWVAVGLALGLPTACTSEPPQRPAEWWRAAVVDADPVRDAVLGLSANEASSGAPLALAGDDWLFSWSRDQYGAPRWALQVRGDGSAAVVGCEFWADGAVLRAAYRRLEFQLDAATLTAVREYLSSSGLLQHWPEDRMPAGAGESTWRLRLRSGAVERHCRCAGEFPAAAAAAVQAVWTELVPARAAQLAVAPLTLGGDAAAALPEFAWWHAAQGR
ncbi:MAG: hypothetical protein JNK49_10165 [Planctomycetes bacterium]|nr:hypothetical protein [Planctomycetota bacterium]